jgi:hypothetical protein
MPLLDHFRPPLFPKRHWESFHVAWASVIADSLNNDLLPEGYFAEEHAHAGARIEIDVATFQDADRNGGITTAVKTYAPPAPPLTVPAAFPDEFEVRIYAEEGGARLVAAVELVSPANKDRDAHRRAFVSKCAGYLAQGISLIVIDVVTSRHADLHTAILSAIGQPSEAVADRLFATAYRPIVRDENELIEIWPHALTLGKSLPTLPLALSAEVMVPIDLEETYSTAAENRRLT